MFMQLTDEQNIILNNCLDNLYVSSSPGSGKSTMLSHICTKLLNNINNNVMLISFTNKAAKSIIDKCANNDQTRITGGTFHGIAYKLMKLNGLDFSICDEYKKTLIIKKLFPCKGDKEKREKIYDEISNLKSKWPLNMTNENLIKYQEELKKYNLIDFDDIIYKFIEYCPDLAIPNITHIIVDELQDTSAPQLEMLKAIKNKLNCNMLAACDDDQCLYSWRGARPENVKDFIKIFNCKILNMGYNFRSTKTIVEKSINLIENNKKRIEKVIKPFKKENGSILEYQCKDPLSEITFVINKCLQNNDKKIAILYRNRTYKNHLEFELKKKNLKYTVNDMFEITDRSAIKSMLSLLRIATNDFDIYDLENASKAIKGLGKTTVQKIHDELDKKKDNISTILNHYAYNSRLKKRFESIVSIKEFYKENHGKSLNELVTFIESKFNDSFNFQDDMRSFLIDITKIYFITAASIKELYNELGLNSKEENHDEDATIELSTVHSYKGLQSNVIILPWCQQYEPRVTEDMEDERRLFYVAITRAESKLYMTYSGDMPRFIKEMDL